MFTLRRLLTYPLSKNRQLLRNYQAMKRDPGIQQRKKLLNDMDAEELDDTELEELESDFMDVHKTHREHLDEEMAAREKLKYHIVRQKYFKVKYPNFLTWHDKQQMKYLHSTYPDEWTIEKLSESFPALPGIIVKVIEAKYKKDERRIAIHDAAVQKNWTAFKNNEFPELPQRLVEHLNKFTNRALNLSPFKIVSDKKVVVNKPKSTRGFSEIITSYEKLKKKNQEEEESPQVSLKTEKIDSSEGSYSSRKSKHLVTLDALQRSIERKVTGGADVTEDEKHLLKYFNDSKGKQTKLIGQDITDIYENRYTASGSGGLTKKPKETTTT